MFVAQRRDVNNNLGIEVKTLCQITPMILGSHLFLRAPDMDTLEVSMYYAGGIKQIQVWRDVCEGIDMGNEAAEWLNTFLGLERPDHYRLVRRPEIALRRSKSGKSLISYQDAYPFLIISQASLDDLNQRIIQNGGEPVPMDRFRPNIVLEGCEPYAEDHMKKIRIGEVILEGATLCVRCPVTMTNQLTAQRGPEPIRTLMTYRANPDGKSAVFGRNFDYEKIGHMEVDETVEVLEWD